VVPCCGIAERRVPVFLSTDSHHEQLHELVVDPFVVVQTIKSVKTDTGEKLFEKISHRIENFFPVCRESIHPVRMCGSSQLYKGSFVRICKPMHPRNQKIPGLLCTVHHVYPKFQNRCNFEGDTVLEILEKRLLFVSGWTLWEVGGVSEKEGIQENDM
jgi:hypothetical protein